jgi:hypothetical protein
MNLLKSSIVPSHAQKQTHRLSSLSSPQFVLFLFRRAQRKALGTGQEIFLPTPNYGHLPPHDPKYTPPQAFLTVSLPSQQILQPSMTISMQRAIDEIPHTSPATKEKEDLDDVIFTLAPTTLSRSYGRSRRDLLLRLRIGRS